MGRVGRIGLLVNVPENSKLTLKTVEFVFKASDFVTDVETAKKTPSVTALSSSSLDSESTHSSRQFPSTLTICTGTAQAVDEKPCVPLQEPDVIASTKPSIVQKQLNTTQTAAIHAPVAPPRRKKKNKTSLQLTVSWIRI